MQNRGCFLAMVVAGTAALVLGLSWTFYFLPRWKKLLTSNLCLTIELRLESYQRRFTTWPDGENTDILLALRGRNPDSLVFVKDSDGFPVANNAFVDQWETPLRFNRDTSGVPRAISAGPNKRHGDADDIDATAARGDALKLYGSNDKIPKFEPEAPAAPATPAPKP
ncbi:MAG: hypothetical protein ACKO2G_04145 [Verrucomicrobiales bacterium]